MSCCREQQEPIKVSVALAVAPLLAEQGLDSVDRSQHAGPRMLLQHAVLIW
jgi:hypothetical protein